MFKQLNRTYSILVITICYVLAAFLGTALYNHLPYSPWLSLLIADIAATLFIWFTSLLLRNASVYDPYWSIQPLVILGLTMLHTRVFDIGSILLYLVIFFWGIRLTYNWMKNFPGLHEQDWRYDLLDHKTGKFFPLVNLFGIQMMPTLIVYACILPAFYYISYGGGLGPITIVGLFISLVGTILELVADYQMYAFRNVTADRSKLIRHGLWRHARHPNYFGEILVWWGVFVVMLSIYPQYWYLCLGALINTLLFNLISIPLAEKHLAAYKENYEQYVAETRVLLPVPKKFRQSD
jgi:steroid 5-alpha reductase family enzyme